MISDTLENAHHYLALHQGFAKAIEFLVRPDLEQLPVGTHGIDEDRIYAMVSKAVGGRKEDALLETHEKYIDIQLVVAGTDNMGWKPKSLCRQPSGKYDPETDLQFFSDKPTVWLPTAGNMFVIFFPEDAHMPAISSGQLHKVVVKVAVDPGR